MTKVVVIYNPTKISDPDDLQDVVGAACLQHDLPAPSMVSTTEDDPGEGMARDAVRDGATLVLSAGGDGTVMSISRGLAGTDVPMGILPGGTGNLLARNLDIPLTMDEAVQVAVTGVDRRLDLGEVSADGAKPLGFAVMVGLGFDAAMMRDAPSGLKNALGWPAYLVSGLKHLRDKPVRVTVTVDDQPAVTRDARCVVIGNVGTLQGGVQLLADADPCDGQLDVVVLSPRRISAWIRVLLQVLLRRERDKGLDRFRGRHVVVVSQNPQPHQLDGDEAGTASKLVADACPGALLVRVAP